MKNIITWFVHNRVAADLLMIFLFLTGFITLLSIKVEVVPDVSPDIVTIKVVYNGASPSEIEESIINPIEEQISGLDGIKEITSSASENIGIVTVEAQDNWDIRKLKDDIENTVDRITTIPKSAERPIIEQMVKKFQVLSISVYGKAPEKTLKKIVENIKDDLTKIKGITSVELGIYRPEEIHIEIPNEILRKYNLTLGDIADRIRANGYDIPGGRVKTFPKEILIRTKGKKYYAKDYAAIPIITKSDGTILKLGDIAILKDSFDDNTRLKAFFNGERAITINVYRIGNQNTLKISKLVRKYIDKIKYSLPSNVKVEVFNDSSIILKDRINLLLKNMLLGIILVIISLGLFLNLKLSYWITLGIPLSFAGALALLPHFDSSINMISLFAFIMVSGMVVDDAIVIGENIYTKREQGLSPFKASIEGGYEVGIVVIFSVLTTVAAFFPLLCGTGPMGKFIRQIPIVVISVLCISLLEALFILPVHLAHTKFETHKPSKTAKLLKKIIRGPYRKTLFLSLKWRYISLSLSIFILIMLIGLVLGKRIQYNFFPKLEGDVISCSFTLPSGTPISETQKLVKYIEEKGRETILQAEKKYNKKLLKYTISFAGASGILKAGPGEIKKGDTVGNVLIQLVSSEKRGNVSSLKLANIWKKNVGDLPQVEDISFTSSLMTMGSDIDIAFSHKNKKTLLKAIDDFKKEIANFGGIYNITDSFIEGKPELRIKLKPLGYALGLNLNDIAYQIRYIFYGDEAVRFQREKDEIKVLVRYPEKERESLTTLKNLRIRLRNGKFVPFLDVASVKIDKGYTTIRHKDLRRIISVSADVDETTANPTEVRNDILKTVIPKLLEKYPGLTYSQEGAGKRQKESFQDIFRGFLISLFAVYALISISLNSFYQAFIIMLAIPFGIIGAIIGHIIMGINLSIISIFGLVGLSGIVVNDALVLMDKIKNFRNAGISSFRAVLGAGIKRFRAVMLTTVTTFFGLFPMVTEKSLQARVLVPMAISIAFGVLFATFITLYMIPVFYLITEDIKSILKKIPKKSYK